MININDKVIYRGPRSEFWGRIGIVKARLPGGEAALEFKGREQPVNACPSELTHAGEKL